MGAVTRTWLAFLCLLLQNKMHTGQGSYHITCMFMSSAAWHTGQGSYHITCMLMSSAAWHRLFYYDIGMACIIVLPAMSLTARPNWQTVTDRIFGHTSDRPVPNGRRVMNNIMRQRHTIYRWLSARLQYTPCVSSASNVIYTI